MNPVIRTGHRISVPLVALGALSLGIAGTATLRAQSRVTENALPLLAAKKAHKLLLSQPVPEYPAVAKINYIQGLVRLLATVNLSGDVTEAHVVKGHPFLAASALKAVQHWLFRPAMSRPGPPEFQTYVDVHFSLRSRKVTEVPSEPERDLSRQVHPPEIVESGLGRNTASVIRMRVLVSPEGHALDSQPLDEFDRRVEGARRTVATWNFRPARWGAMPVPWYLEVEVPLPDWPEVQRAAGSAGH